MIKVNKYKTKNKELEMVTITKKEYDFLNQVSNSDFAEWVNEMGWVGDYISQRDYDMKSCRGLMSSLEQKNIIAVGKPEKSLDDKFKHTSVSIELDYLDCDKGKLKNITVKGG